MNEYVAVKEWFISKNFDQEERYIISISDMEIMQESEKAIKIAFKSKFGNIFSWIPKSCMIKASEMAKIIKDQNDKFNAGVEKYNNLLNWAKDQGVSVRKNMKKETILTKIKAFGLEIPEEFI